MNKHKAEINHALTSSSLCRNVGSQWALEQAKYNLVNEYMLVGVTEELEDFVMMLEAALPRFFKGATELYKTGSLRAFCAQIYQEQGGRWVDTLNLVVMLKCVCSL